MTDSKTATERLRKELMARGVEWESKDVEGVKGFHDTRWQAMGVQWCYVEFVGNNYTKLKPAREFHCTPEQAIAATLGANRESELQAKVDELLDKWFRQAKEIEGLEAENAKLQAALNKAAGNWAKADAKATELESLSKLKRAGRLRFWRATIEIPEDELHEICDEIQTEHEQAIATTLGRPKAKSHPYGYEPDTGCFDATRCECGCINDISAGFCNDCGGEIEIDETAEKEIYKYNRNSVFAVKHDDGSLEFGGKRYIAVTLGSEHDRKLLAEAEREIVILRDKLRIANETGTKTCVKCGTFLSDELLCTSCAATLRSGECEVEETEWLSYGGEGCDTYRHTLSCGHVSETFDEEPPNFCCECGAKVKAVKR